MIYCCKDCINRVNCPQNQKQYQALCRKIGRLIKKKSYHCFYSLRLKCDYFVADRGEVYCCPVCKAGDNNAEAKEP